MYVHSCMCRTRITFFHLNMVNRPDAGLGEGVRFCREHSMDAGSLLRHNPELNGAAKQPSCLLTPVLLLPPRLHCCVPIIYRSVVAMVTGLHGTVGKLALKFPQKDPNKRDETGRVWEESYVDLDTIKNDYIILPGTSGSSNKCKIEKSNRKCSAK